MFVQLSSVGNPDFRQNPDTILWGCEENKAVEVSSFKEASQVCKDFIERNDLGSGNWAGGLILDNNGNAIAHVSYNGRVWEGKEYTLDAKEIKI